MAARLVTVVILTPEASCRVAGPCERSAGLSAEGLLRKLGSDTHPVAFWVECEDQLVGKRLTNYLCGVRSEVLAEPGLVAMFPMP